MIDAVTADYTLLEYKTTNPKRRFTMPKHQTPEMSDKDIMSNPDTWPCWPYLPVKRKDNSLEKGNLGFLLADQDFADGKFVIWHLYMFKVKREDYDTAKKLEYSSIDDILKDGWIID